MANRIWRVIVHCARPLSDLPSAWEQVVMVMSIAGLGAYTQLDLLAPFRPDTPEGWVASTLLLLFVLSAWGALRYQNKVDELETLPRPRLVLNKLWTDFVHCSDGTPTGRHAWSTYVQFVNRPTAHRKEAVAHNVAAHLSFYKLDGKTPFLITQISGALLGYWSDPEQTGTRIFGKSNRDRAKVDFEVGEIPWNLDLVTKPQGEGAPECYAVSNQYPAGDTLNHILSNEPFTVKVELKGDAVNDTWWFEVTPNGATYVFIKVISGARDASCPEQYPPPWPASGA